MSHIIFDNHHAGRTYARLIMGQVRTYLGVLTPGPTPLLDLVLNHVGSLPSTDVETIRSLQLADKSWRDPDRKPGRPKKRKTL